MKRESRESLDGVGMRRSRSSAMQVSKKGMMFEERARTESIEAAFKEKMTELKERDGREIKR